MSEEMGATFQRLYEGFTQRLQETWSGTSETTQERGTPPASSESRSEWTPRLTSGRQRYHGTLPANSMEELRRYYTTWRNQLVRSGRVRMVVSPRTFSELCRTFQADLSVSWTHDTHPSGETYFLDSTISMDAHAQDGVAYMIQEDVQEWEPLRDPRPPSVVEEHNARVRSRRMGSRPWWQETPQDLESRLHNIREEMKLTILSKPAEWRRLAESEKDLVKQVIAARAKAPAPEPAVNRVRELAERVEQQQRELGLQRIRVPPAPEPLTRITADQLLDWTDQPVDWSLP